MEITRKGVPVPALGGDSLWVLTSSVTGRSTSVRWEVNLHTAFGKGWDTSAPERSQLVESHLQHCAEHWDSETMKRKGSILKGPVLERVSRLSGVWGGRSGGGGYPLLIS